MLLGALSCFGHGELISGTGEIDAKQKNGCNKGKEKGGEG